MRPNILKFRNMYTYANVQKIVPKSYTIHKSHLRIHVKHWTIHVRQTFWIVNPHIPERKVILQCINHSAKTNPLIWIPNTRDALHCNCHPPPNRHHSSFFPKPEAGGRHCTSHEARTTTLQRGRLKIATKQKRVIDRCAVDCDSPVLFIEFPRFYVYIYIFIRMKVGYA